jgi:predicted RNase H-like nuclease (RuvC/YqgF family)
MFKKLKEFCKIKKEKAMPDTTNTTSRTNRQFKKEIAAQNHTIETLKDRVNVMRDEIVDLKSEITNFQRRVQSDMTEVFEGMKEISKRR